MMKKLLCIGLLLMGGMSAFSQQTINATITHDGGQREYILYVPASYDGSTAVPLLLCFHGYTSSNSVIMSYSNFNAVADTANIIVAYPKGTLYGGNTHWNVGGWTVGSTTDDVGFVDALLDTIDMDYNIDASRVYSTGMSNGGYMSFLLACQLSDRIAAIASITGSMTPQTFNACNPQHPTPILQIHGDNDGTVPYGGDSWTKSINDVLSYWSSFNNSGVQDTTMIPNTNTTDGSTVNKIQFDYGDNCVLVDHYRVNGGDHDWPGAWGNMDISATNVAWDFLRQFDINGISGCTASISKNNSTSAIKIFPNPTTTHLTIEQDIKGSSPYKVYDMQGRVVLDGVINGLNPTIDVSTLRADLYILEMNSQHISFVVSH